MGRTISLAILALFLAAGHFLIYMNADSAALLNASMRLLAGEELNRDFIEINPPLIVYITALPVYMHQLLGIEVAAAFNLFVALLAALSLVMVLLKVENNWLKAALVVLIFMPFSNIWGQREHLYIVLILPYFMALLRDDKPGFAGALMAAVGFCIKPYFLLVWGGLLMVKMVMERRFVFGLYDIVIGVFAGLYLAFLICFEQNYIGEVVPYLLRHYTLFKSAEVFTLVLCCLVLCQVSFWVLFYTDRGVLNRGIYFASYANILSLIVVAVQERMFVYYFYPCLFFGVLTNILIIIATMNKHRQQLARALFISCVLVAGYFGMVAKTNIDRDNIIALENNTGRMVAVYNQYAENQPVYFLGITFAELYFPAVIYSTSFTKSYYGTLWPLPSIVAGDKADDEEFRRRVMMDIKAHPPAAVIVSRPAEYVWHRVDPGFDYIAYFSRDAEFAAIWKKYRLLHNFNGQDVYVRDRGL